MSTMLERAQQVADAALPQDKVPYGPWLGSMRSVSQDQVPRDYAAGGAEFLYQPRLGTWKRRRGTSTLFEASPGSPVGRLPAKWGARCRWMEEFTRDNTELGTAYDDRIQTGIPSIIALLTKETVATDVVDDGRFSQLWLRDQDNDVDYTLGDEFSSTTYPQAGSGVQSLRFIPLWYDSGDGGLTRGVDEFSRRMFFGGSRRFQRVGNWWYFPSLLGTPSRWRGMFTPDSSVTIHDRRHPTATSGGISSWHGQDAGTTNLQNYINETTRDDANYITEAGSSGSSMLTVVMWANGAFGTAPASGTTAVFRLTSRRYIGSGGAAGNERMRYTIKSGTTTVKTADTNTTNTSTFDLIEVTLSAAEYANINFSSALTVELSTVIQGNTDLNHQHSWIELAFATGAVPSPDANRLIPSGPLPPTHAGYLARGAAVATGSSTVLHPDGDVGAGSWSPSTGSTLYETIDETTADDSDYISCATGGSTCEVSLGNPGFVPTSATHAVTIKFRSRQTNTLVPGTLAVELYQGAVLKATISMVPTGGFQTTSAALNATQIDTDITDWTDLRLRMNFASGSGTTVQVSFADLEITASADALEGGWRGHDRFFFSVAYRFEDDSIWMPCAPRFPNDILPNGLNLFTVDPDNPDTAYDKVTWFVPIGPYGVKSRILLRGNKIDSTADDNLQLDPYDLRVVWELRDNASTVYEDTFADDAALAFLPDPVDTDKDLYIRWDHRMPPRARHMFAGDMRVCHSYGGLNPSAITLAPAGRDSDFDLNLSDGDTNAYDNDGSFMRVVITPSGGNLQLLKTDGSSALASLTLDFATYDTLQKLADAINATTVDVDGLQWRAQVLQGANPDASPLTSLTPHFRQIDSCVVSGQSITKAAGGLSKVAVGALINGTGVTTGAYVTKIVSDTELTFTGTVTSGTKTLNFYFEFGDIPRSANANEGWQRVIANSLPGFLYYNKTYLNTEPVEPAATWMTMAQPGQVKAAANSFLGRVANKHTPPLKSGICMGGAASDQGFVIGYSDKIGRLMNSRDSGTGLDSDYRLQMLNESRGAVSPVVPGNKCAITITQDGVVCIDLEREALISEAIWLNDPPFGDFDYEMPLSVAAAGMDDDSGYFRLRVMRSQLWINFRSSGSHPNRQVVYDFSSGMESAGLAAMVRTDGTPWGWSQKLLRSVTAMVEGRRETGSHLYAWGEQNNGSVGDGRVYEIEDSSVTTDDGTEIASASLKLPWERLGRKQKLSAQEITIEHSSPDGSTGALIFHRSYSDAQTSLTLTTSNTLPVLREVAMLPQDARAGTDACYLEYTQTVGLPRELRSLELRAKALPSYD